MGEGIDVHGTSYHGRKSSIGTSAVQMTSVSKKILNGVVVKASTSNSGIVYVGNSSGVTADVADATSGFELTPGESVRVEVSNINKIYLIASALGQKVYYWGD